MISQARRFRNRLAPSGSIDPTPVFVVDLAISKILRHQCLQDINGRAKDFS